MKCCSVFVLVLVGVAIAWVPIIVNYPNSELFNYIQDTTSCLAPPVCSVYLLAMFWPRTTEPVSKPSHFCTPSSSYHALDCRVPSGVSSAAWW